MMGTACNITGKDAGSLPVVPVADVDVCTKCGQGKKMRTGFGIFLVCVAIMLAGTNVAIGSFFVDKCEDYTAFPISLIISGATYSAIAILMVGTIWQWGCYGCLVAIFTFVHFAFHFIESIFVYILWSKTNYQEKITTNYADLIQRDFDTVNCSALLVVIALILVSIGWAFIIITGCWLWSWEYQPKNKPTTYKMNKSKKAANISFCVQNIGHWFEKDQGKEPLIADV